MTQIRKVHEGIADLSTTYALLNRHNEKPWRERTATLFDGEWWETDEATYQEFLEMMPPALMRSDCFVMLEAKIDSIHSVFYRLGVDGETRYFHAQIDLADRSNLDKVRSGILESLPANAPTP